MTLPPRTWTISRGRPEDRCFRGGHVIPTEQPMYVIVGLARACADHASQSVDWAACERERRRYEGRAVAAAQAAAPLGLDDFLRRIGVRRVKKAQESER